MNEDDFILKNKLQPTIKPMLNKNPIEAYDCMDNDNINITNNNKYNNSNNEEKFIKKINSQASKIEDMDNKIKFLNKDNTKLKSIIKAKDDEITHLKRKKNYMNKIAEGKLEQLGLNTKIINKVEFLENYKKNEKDIENLLRTNKLLENKNKEWKLEIFNLNNNLKDQSSYTEDFMNYKIKYEEKSIELNKELFNYKNVNNNLSIEVKSIKLYNEELNKKSLILKENIENIEKEINEKDSELNNLYNDLDYFHRNILFEFLINCNEIDVSIKEKFKNEVIKKFETIIK